MGQFCFLSTQREWQFIPFQYSKLLHILHFSNIPQSSTPFFFTALSFKTPMNARFYGMQRRKGRIDEKQHRRGILGGCSRCCGFHPLNAEAVGSLEQGEAIKLIVVRYIGMQTAARRRPALVVPIYETNTIHYLCNHTCFAGGGAWRV